MKKDKHGLLMCSYFESEFRISLQGLSRFIQQISILIIVFGLFLTIPHCVLNQFEPKSLTFSKRNPCLFSNHITTRPTYKWLNGKSFPCNYFLPLYSTFWTAIYYALIISLISQIFLTRLEPIIYLMLTHITNRPKVYQKSWIKTRNR